MSRPLSQGLVPLLMLGLCAGSGGAATATPSPEATRIITVNSHVSNRQIALNQPVRIEFTTMPRQVANIDIETVVGNSLLVNSSWRLLGRPSVVEHEKTKTITIGVALLPRTVGSLALPQIPVSWLQGDQAAEFGVVTVANGVLVGSETKDLPKETAGVAGFPWGAHLADLKTTRIADNLIEYLADRAIARPQPGLELIFRGGDLSEAVVAAPGLTIEQARESFFSRWGLPQIEEPNSISWILGWTRITATTPGGDATGVKLTIAREDILAKQNQTAVKDTVFDVLDGARTPPAQVETEEQAKERRKHEAEEFLKMQKQAPTPKAEEPVRKP
ncbi:MAG: hypothetical protein H0W83_05750 [Planctomycetes bacterium]|nr:hypothetical protein [Planctomycetota bacterium]